MKIYYIFEKLNKFILTLVILILLLPNVAVQAPTPVSGLNRGVVEHEKNEQSLDLESAPGTIPGNGNEQAQTYQGQASQIKINSLNQPIVSNQQRTFPKDHPMNDYSDVLVIVNDNSSISKQIGQYFKTARNIPDKNMCVINISIAETITYTIFQDLRTQVENYLENNDLTEKINYIVTTKGVPLRISHSTLWRDASVDNELCLILDLYAQYIDDPTNTKIANPYYNKDRDFSHTYDNIYLVTRLTGFNFSQVKQLIDNAAASAGQRGSFLFDRDPSKTGGTWGVGNQRMNTAHTLLGDKGLTSSLDWTSAFITDRNNLAGYASWGGNDNRYLSTPAQNIGFETDNSPTDGVPDNWFFDISNTTTDHININNSINYTGTQCIEITRDALNTSSYTAISQNVTVQPGLRYYTRGYVNIKGSFTGGGAQLRIRAWNSTNDLVWNKTGAIRSSTNNNWYKLLPTYYHPQSGVTKVMITALVSKSSGTAFFDNVGLYEIRPRHSYVPGAIGEFYGQYTALTFDYDNPINRFYYTELNVGELISDGITGIKGQVDRSGTYIDTNSRVNILFDMYTEGYTLAESFYLASPYLSWIDVVIGDPKAAPYFDRLPDGTLETKNITFSKEHPNQGDKIKIFATIENRGGTDFRNVDVSFRVGNETQSIVIDTKEIPLIEAGGDIDINCDWDTTDHSGLLTVSVEVDSSWEFRETNETNNIRTVQLAVNAHPHSLEYKLPDKTVNRGEPIDIFVNVSDNETPEDQQNTTIFINHSSASTWTLLTNVYYQVDHWHARFETGPDTITGSYDVKINISDENNVSIELIKASAFNILNNMPVLGSLEVSGSAIYRTSKLTINFSAEDIEDGVSASMLEVNIRPDGSGSQWIILDLPIIYSQTLGVWQMIYTSNITDKLGKYDVRVTFVDNDDDVTTIELPNAFEILNNVPEIQQVTLDKASIFRQDYATIHIYGGDVESAPLDTTLLVEYKLDQESFEWSSELFSIPKWKSSHWEVSFISTSETLTGDYIFQVRITDGDSAQSQFVKTDGKLEVLNNPPVPRHNFGSGIFKAKEDVTILFDAGNSSDMEDITCSGFYWNFGDGNISTQANVYHTYTNEGEYNVKLLVNDQSMAEAETNFTININNVAPSANIIIKTTGTTLEVGLPITFNGTGSYDTISDKADLAYHWEFGDGNTSNLSTVNHIYSKPGTKKVELTVTDDNNASNTKFIFIDITPGKTEPEEDDDKKEGKDNSVFILIAIVIVVILVILGLVAWFSKRRQASIRRKTLEKPAAMVKATIGDVPDSLSSSMKIGIEAGRTVKPGSLLPVTTTTTKTTVPVPQLTKGSQLKSVEVEYVPKLTMPRSKPSAPTELNKAARQDETVTAQGEPELDVMLPPSKGKLTIRKPEHEYEQQTAKMDKDKDSDMDFKPPKIDLSDILESIVPKPVQPHRHEILEAHKRGEGVALQFKKPTQK